MKRHLGEFNVLLRKDGQVVFQIGEQSHRGKEFTPLGQNSFRSLSSATFPHAGPWSLRLKGDMDTLDTTILVTREDMFKQFQKDRLSYNKRFK